jgi:hypothetical protein
MLCGRVFIHLRHSYHLYYFRPRSTFDGELMNLSFAAPVDSQPSAFSVAYMAWSAAARAAVLAAALSGAERVALKKECLGPAVAKNGR